MNEKEPIDRVKAERDAALEALERVRAAHPKNQFKAGGKAYDYCGGCYEPFEAAIWPCPTIQALDGAPEPEWEYRATTDSGAFAGESRTAPEHAVQALQEAVDEYPMVLDEQGVRVERRRKAGPWEVVGGEKP